MNVNGVCIMRVAIVDPAEHQSKVLIDHEELDLIIKRYVMWNKDLNFSDYSVISKIEFQTVVENNVKIGTQAEVWVTEKQ